LIVTNIPPIILVTIDSTQELINYILEHIQKLVIIYFLFLNVNVFLPFYGSMPTLLKTLVSVGK